MRLNENVKIVGNKVVLVPYETKHVPKYHEWMQSSELQKLTASEPLTLEEEYEMQQSWREDEDKCTFLILGKEQYKETGEEIASLIGDTNLFLRIDDEATVSDYTIAEAEIMIAESSSRGKGYGWEAMLLMLKYAQTNLNVQKFEVKVNIANTQSLNMFTKMHFNEVCRSAVFEEVTLECNITKEWIKWLDNQVNPQYTVYR
ncbi:N-acetyltransferase 9-like protein [Teleopsis dalmanni]|uniref:N-acetyltransferase 9-like protein n=1 Tax=Teleopsis dalmanni TaxID=139649 RepID=UPI0018CEA4F8|nr:N-acetyltransferase 9-like protein [Teleopsis dalmanni]